MGSVDPQGRFNPDRFAAKTATPASDAVEAWRELDRLLGESEESEYGVSPKAAAELARREFEDESDFKDWLRDNSDEANDAFDRIRDEMLKAADGDKYQMNDLELYRRQNQWLDNNLQDLLRVYGARIKEPKPEPESGAEGNIETGGRPQKIEAVRAAYKNADGTMRADYMRAPNGRPTNLSEEDWLYVRTPEFKAKYGDWEALAEYEFLDGEAKAEIPFEDLNSPKIDKNTVLSYWEKKYSDRKKGKSFEFESVFVDGEVIVNEQTIRSTISKGNKNSKDMWAKNKALACIGEIIEKGIVINASNDWKGRGYPSLMLAIPINIHNGRAFEKYVATVVVAKKISERHRDGGIKRRNKAYVVDSINVRSLESKLSPSTQLNVSGNQRNKIPSSVEEALINIWNVNKKNIKIGSGTHYAYAPPRRTRLSTPTVSEDITG